MKRFLGPLCFVSFCFLIAFRDVLADRLLTCNGCIHPTFLLLTWSVECAVLAWLVRSIRKKSFGFIKPFRQLRREQQLDFVKLGIATWIVYVATFYGIRALTAPIFNLFDYGTMPILTLFAAWWMNKEDITKKQVVGAVFSVVGMVLLLSVLIGKNLSPIPHWQIWIGLSFLSPIFTSVCNSLQHDQVDKHKMAPDEVLLYRFPIPALLMVIWFAGAKLTETPEAPINLGLSNLPALLLIGAVTVFLPLWLLCYGFVFASVGQFASYLFLIAVFTFALAPLVVNRLWNPARLPIVLVSAVLLLIGYMVAEGLLARKVKPA